MQQLQLCCKHCAEEKRRELCRPSFEILSDDCLHWTALDFLVWRFSWIWNGQFWSRMEGHSQDVCCEEAIVKGWMTGTKVRKLDGCHPISSAPFLLLKESVLGSILMPHPLFSKERLEVSCLQSAHCYVKDGRGVYPTEWYLRDLQEAEFCWKPSKSHKQQTWSWDVMGQFELVRVSMQLAQVQSDFGFLSRVLFIKVIKLEPWPVVR